MAKQTKIFFRRIRKGTVLLRREKMEVETKKRISKDSEKLMALLIEKSQESFLLSIELFNKPTISLNVEGFVIFICNAWELLFKAYLISQGDSIYYKKTKSKNRTLALDALIKKILTNEHDSVRINLEIISGIRNSATHLIVPEYSILFNEVFLSCVRNYVDKLYKFFTVNINDKFNADFLTLHIPSNKKIDILGKYGNDVYQKYNNISFNLNRILTEKRNENGYVPPELAVSYQINFKRVNDIEKADLKIYNSKEKDSLPTITIEKPIDITTNYPHTTNNIITLVNDQLIKNGISFIPYTIAKNTKFTTDTFSLFCKGFDIKSNKEYAYLHKIGNNQSYTYSLKLVQHIINCIINDPEIFIKLKNNKKKLTSGAREF